MAMHAGLVAAIADIDLQRIEASAADGGKSMLEQGPSLAHGPRNRTIARRRASLHGRGREQIIVMKTVPT